MTDLQRARLSELAIKLREVARRTGPMHSWWDTIGDIEAVVQGHKPVFEQSAEDWIVQAEQMLRET